MCCSVCPTFPCRTSLSLRVHDVRHGGLPAPHYHLCKGTTPCALNCQGCMARGKELARAPAGHYEYGCCHLCPSYAACSDFAQLHVDAAAQYTQHEARV